MMTKARSAIAMPKLGLGREIAIVLLIKLAVIWLAAVFVFGPNHRPQIDAAEVEAHLIGPATGASLLFAPQRPNP
ncbi:MAG: cytochrome oxidase putative small subunit CydP [Methylovirgula sp.]